LLALSLGVTEPCDRVCCRVTECVARALGRRRQRKEDVEKGDAASNLYLGFSHGKQNKALINDLARAKPGNATSSPPA
jgi:hypothetical protein